MDETEKRRRYLEGVRDQAANEKAFYRGAFNDSVNRAYLYPDKAREKMQRLVERAGEDAVRDMLANKPAYFGVRHGSMLSWDGFRLAANGRRADSTTARLELPDLFDRHRDARRREAAAINELERLGSGLALARARKTRQRPEPQSRIREPDRLGRGRTRARGR